MDNNEFPNIKSTYYEDELADMEEERRLFYVACSRAKKYLTITYGSNEMSVFIREIDEQYYNGHNINKKNIIAQSCVKTILKVNGYKNISHMLKELKNEEKYIHEELKISSYIANLKNKVIISNFMNLLICQMIQNNYNIKFDTTPSFDNKTHWSNLLDDIFTNASINIISIEVNAYKNFLLLNKEFYKNIETCIKKIIDSLKYKNIKIDNDFNILVDDTIIKINLDTCTIINLTKILLKQKNKIINKIIFYNPQHGKINVFDTSNFNFISFYEKFNETIPIIKNCLEEL
jgi:hypothetical protein